MTDDPSRIEQPSRAPRDSVMLGAVLQHFGGGAPTRHRVRDLSAGGVRIDQAGGMQVGATVLVTVGALEAIGATVMWVRYGSAGLKFANTVDPDDARARAAIAPAPIRGQVRDLRTTAPSAGWVRELDDPYRQ